MQNKKDSRISLIWWLLFKKEPNQFWREIWIEVLVILLQLYQKVGPKRAIYLVWNYRNVSNMPDALLRSRGENKKLPHGGHSDGDDKHTHSWQLYQGAAQKKSFASRKMRAKVADSAKEPPCYIDKKQQKVSFGYKWIDLYAQTKSLILLQYRVCTYFG